MGRKAGSSSSDEGPSVFFLVEGKRRRIIFDWNGSTSSSEEFSGEESCPCCGEFRSG